MEIVYGKNATNKSVDAQAAHDRGALVLTARMDEWKDSKLKTFTQFNQTLIRKVGKHDKKIKDAFAATNRAALGYTGRPADLKKMLNTNDVFKDTTGNYDQFNSIEDIAAPILIGNITEQMANAQAMNSLSELVKSLTQVEYDNLMDLTLFKKSIKTAIAAGTGPIMTQLVTLATTVQNEINQITSGDLKTVVKGGNDSLLNILRTAVDPGITIVNSNINNLLKNLKLFLGPTFITEWDNIKTLKENRMQFSNNQTNIEKLQNDYGVTISLTDNDKKFGYSGGDISDGQFTMLATQMILNSVSYDKEVIFDDVLETLDDENEFKLLSILANFRNAKVLTHSSRTVDVANMVSETVDVPVVKTKKTGGSPALTWGDLLTNMKNASTPDLVKLNMKSILKVLSRYVARNAVIHSFAGNEPAASYEPTTHNEHWMLAGRLMHYHPEIEVSTLLVFFPNMTFSGATLNTLELIEQLCSWLSTSKTSNPNIFGISLNQCEVFLEKLKIEIIIEKDIYDAYAPTAGSTKLSHFWGDPKKAFSKYRDERKSRAIAPRDNSFVHSIDNSPLDLI